MTAQPSLARPPAVRPGRAAAGDKASAVKNFKRSLESNPKNSYAAEHLKKLDADAAKDGLRR